MHAALFFHAIHKKNENDVDVHSLLFMTECSLVSFFFPSFLPFW